MEEKTARILSLSPDFRKTFGEAVLRLRSISGMTQVEFGKRTHASSRDAVARLERGEAEFIGIQMLGGIMDILSRTDMTFEQFLTGEPPGVHGSRKDLMSALAEIIIREEYKSIDQITMDLPPPRPMTPAETVVLNSLCKVVAANAQSRQTVSASRSSHPISPPAPPSQIVGAQSDAPRLRGLLDEAVEIVPIGPLKGRTTGITTTNYDPLIEAAAAKSDEPSPAPEARGKVWKRPKTKP